MMQRFIRVWQTCWSVPIFLVAMLLALLAFISHGPDGFGDCMCPWFWRKR